MRGRVGLLKELERELKKGRVPREGGGLLERTERYVRMKEELERRQAAVKKGAEHLLRKGITSEGKGSMWRRASRTRRGDGEGKQDRIRCGRGTERRT